MSQRVNAYAAWRAEEKDQTVRSAPDLQDARVGPDALKLFEQASDRMRFGQQIRTGIMPRLKEVVRLAFLKLEHELKRALRPLVPLMSQQASHPATLHLVGNQAIVQLLSSSPLDASASAYTTCRCNRCRRAL